MRFWLYRKSLYHTSFYITWTSDLLINEIKYRLNLHRKLNQELIQTKTQFRSTVSLLDYLCLCRIISQNVNKYSKNISSHHEYKLRNVGLVSNFLRDPNQIITNYSSKSLSNAEKRILSLGLQFKLPNFSINFYNYFLLFEKLPLLLKNHPIVGNFSSFVESLKNIAHSHYKKFNSHHIFSLLISRNDLQILKNLKSDPSIIICPPDKGQGVVILDTSTYIQKMESILSYTSKFRPLLTQNILLHLIKLEDKINNFLRSLKKKQYFHRKL